MVLMLENDRPLTTARLEHERLTSLINSMADGVIAVDEKIRVVLYNGAALNILDVNSSFKGKSLAAVLKLLDKNNQPVDVIELIQGVTTSITNRDYRLSYDDGSTIDLYFSIAPVHTGYGKADDTGYVLLLRDITREKSLEEERDEFISVVSHELRTPVAITEGNIGNAQFIADRTGDLDQIKAALKAAHQQTLFLADMINDLSTLSRAERGKLTVDGETINVHDLVLELAANYTPEAIAKGLALDTDLSPRLELLRSSKLYVREVLQNFITNALKYTEKGHITIGARPAAKGVYLWVEDSGIGMSKSDQEKIYDKFFRSEDFHTRKTSGTGLGLYVTLKLAQLLHAEINTESTLGKGSKFTIFVPNL